MIKHYRRFRKISERFALLISASSWMVFIVRNDFDKKSSGFRPPNPRDARRFLPKNYSDYCPVTIAIIGLCVVAGIVSSLGANQNVVSWALMSKFAFNPRVPSTFLPEVVQQGQLWRLFTPVFFHIGIMHLLFNMLMFRELGMLLERRYGSLRFFALFVILTLGSSFTQYLFAGPFFFGMSGVLFGLFSYTWIQGKLNPAGFGFVLSNQTVIILLAWFVLCFTNLFGPIANGAHTGGLILGALISWMVAKQTGGNFIERRRQFHEAFSKPDEPLHRCHVCGLTELTSPSTDFRVSSVDGEEYCMAHLPQYKKHM